MQQRWIDQPASDEDVFDRVLASSSAFLNRHMSIILKAGPPLFGFAIFVFYFYRHQFYPSFDLFQFSSLLIAAAAIGFTVIGLLVLALFSPGIWVYYQFLQHKQVKGDLKRGSLEVTRGKGFAVFHPTLRQRRCVGGVGR